MGHAYTPGLKVTEKILVTKKRILPLKGDVLVKVGDKVKPDTVVVAFEVEKTTTIDSGINRFRNLFAVQPNTTIETYIVAPNKRKKAVEKKLSSPANVKNGLTGKIGYILFDDLDIKGSVDKIDFPKIQRKVE